MVNFAEVESKLGQGRSSIVPGDYFPLGGGLDLLTPPLQIKPGKLIGCLNYEAKLAGGYESLTGYERFDGRLRPSQAPYWLVSYSAANGVPATGSTVTSGSGGSAVLLGVGADTNATSGTLVLGRLSGNFLPGGSVAAGSFAALQGISAPLQNGANDDASDAAYRAFATEDYRAIVAVVPGEGPILGVALYRGALYAFRNGVGSTLALMYQATPGGWALIDLGFKLKFTAGQIAGVAAGDTVTGLISGKTALVRRVVISTGTFASASATGYLIVSNLSGTLSNGEALQVAGTTRVTFAGPAIQQGLLPNGRFEFVVFNFYGATGDLRLYGADGVNRAFEFQDGPNGWFAQIETGMPTDAPNHVTQWDARLWLSFPGGSAQRSSVNDPVVWNALTGAAELGIGADITGYLSQVGTLFIFTRDRAVYVQPNPNLAFNPSAPEYIIKDYNGSVGALPGTIQNIGSGLYLDDRGYTTVSSSQNLGGYVTSPVSILIDVLVKQLRTRAIASVVVRSKNRYRCFFSDGQFLSATIAGNKVLAFTRCDYTRAVRGVASEKDASGEELTVFGSDDGYVYIADSGTSFDGEAIVTFARVPFYHSKSPGRIKRYRRADFDITVDGACQISIGVDYSYARPDVRSDPTRSFAVLAGGGFWDISLWNQFRWNAGYIGQAPVKLEGSGENVSFLLASSSATQAQHAFDGVMLRYSPRRLERRANS